MRSIARRRSFLVLLQLAVLAAATLAPLAAERGDDSKRKSKNGHAEASVGGVSVAVDYGRPEVRGRKVWGALVPYGQVWRTGADEATTIRLDRDALVEGQKLAAGTYALFTVPGESEWTVVFSKTAQQWGAYDYKQADDALRVTVRPEAGEMTEALEFTVGPERVVVRWEKLSIGFRVAAAG